MVVLKSSAALKQRSGLCAEYQGLVDTEDWLALAQLHVNFQGVVQLAERKDADSDTRRERRHIGVLVRPSPPDMQTRRASVHQCASAALAPLWQLCGLRAVGIKLFAASLIVSTSPPLPMILYVPHCRTGH